MCPPCRIVRAAVETTRDRFAELRARASEYFPAHRPVAELDPAAQALIVDLRSRLHEIHRIGQRYLPRVRVPMTRETGSGTNAATDRFRRQP
jgi:hypothetical protein